MTFFNPHDTSCMIAQSRRVLAADLRWLPPQWRAVLAPSKPIDQLSIHELRAARERTDAVRDALKAAGCKCDRLA